MGLKVGVIGGGSFGTALANVLSDNHHDVTLWMRRPEVAEDINERNCNSRYLPDVSLNPSLKASLNLEDAVFDKDLLVCAVPTQSMREMLKTVRPLLREDTILISAAKGLELGTQSMLSEIFAAECPDHRAGYFSGPSFAKELVNGLPTAATIASTDPATATFLQGAFANPYLRVYTSHDVIGLEVAGAVKNIMAIASGISDSLGFGHNTRAAVITRGLAEITRLGLELGADRATFMGLSGMGDLVLTCTGDLSRNRRVGLGLGAGKKLEDILEEMGQVAEGVNTAKAVRNLAKRKGVDMPIVEQVYLTLYEGKSPKQAVGDLMERPVKKELA